MLNLLFVFFCLSLLEKKKNVFALRCASRSVFVYFEKHFCFYVILFALLAFVCHGCFSRARRVFSVFLPNEEV